MLFFQKMEQLLSISTEVCLQVKWYIPPLIYGSFGLAVEPSVTLKGPLKI
jgi:hypothetical protein